MTAPFLLTKSLKSIGIALLLTFLFGPIGLLYASVSGGLIMTLTPVIIIALLYAGYWQENVLLMAWQSGLISILIVTYWLIMLIWAVISVKSYNVKLQHNAEREFELWKSIHDNDQNQYIVNIHQKPPEINTSSQRAIGADKPSLKDWAENNPGKSINDYYYKYGRE